MGIMVEVNKFKLGLFIIGSVVLLVIFLLFLGVSERFAPKGKLVSFFSESVQGLDVGSQVKYKGVPIGRVKAIYIDTQDKLIRVDMDIDFKAFTVSGAGDAPMSVNSFYEFFRNERDLGLRCRLDYGGLTGLKYVELDYFAHPGEALPEGAKDFAGAFYIPAAPSSLTNIMDKFNTSLEKIAAVDFKGISDKLVASLTDISGLLSDPQIKQSVARLDSITANWDKISSSMASGITEESVGEFIDNLRSTLNEINTLSKGLSVQVEKARLADTSQSVRQSAVTFGELQRELSITLEKLNQTLDSITVLVDYANEDPSSFITGKNRREISLPSSSGN